VVDVLLGSLTDTKFYYSIPFSTKNQTPLHVNDYVSGVVDTILHDKIFINVIPEGPRALLNLKDFMSSETLDLIEAPSAPKKVVKNPVVKKKEEKKKEEEK
jgi:hypothetical protein